MPKCSWWREYQGWLRGTNDIHKIMKTHLRGCADCRKKKAASRAK